MGKWKKDETEFTVNLNHDQRRGCIAIIPRPILEQLGYPATMTFVLDGDRIEVSSVD